MENMGVACFTKGALVILRVHARTHIHTHTHTLLFTIRGQKHLTLFTIFRRVLGWPLC